MNTQSRCSMPLRNSSDCVWQYTGTGVEYELLAGTLFMVVFGITGVVISLASELLLTRRKIMLTVCILMWSAMTVLSGFTKNYWQLALTRFGLGIFEAGCIPFSTSLISDIFTPKSHGTALGIYNWGIYTGFGSSFVFDFLRDAYGWRWVFYAAGSPGFLTGLLVLFTVKETTKNGLNEPRKRPSARQICKLFLNVPFLLLSIAAASRNGAGLIWAYHVQNFFSEYHPGVETAYYMSWIPVVGGTTGSALGGFISDKLCEHRGTIARMWVLILCQIVAAPFLIGVLYLKPPWAFIIFLLGYTIGDMWIGASFAVIIEMVQPTLRTSSVAGYLLVMNVAGGNMNVLVVPLNSAIGLRYTLLVLYPGLYFVSAILFSLTLCVLHYQRRMAAELRNSEKEPLLGTTSVNSRYSAAINRE